MTWTTFPLYAAGAAVVLVLAWAAHQRGQAHDWWRGLRRDARAREDRLAQWCMAVGTVAGCA
jgi:hypothetical protein